MPQMSSNRLLAKLLSPALRVARAGQLSAAAARVNQSTRLGLEGWMVAVLVLAPFTLRTLLLLDQSLPLGAADAHGYLSDVAVSALAGLLVSALLRRLSAKPLPGFANELACTSWAQLLLKFVVSHPAVTCAIPATSKGTHLRDNMAAGVGTLPDEEMRTRIVEAAGSS